MWFQTVSILVPPTEVHLEIPWGIGVVKSKLLEEKCEAKLEFPGGGEGTKQKPSIRGTWIFSGTTQCINQHKHTIQYLPSLMVNFMTWQL